MSAALFELAVHYAMELSFENAEKRQEYIDWFVKNHKITARGLVFEPQLFTDIIPEIPNNQQDY